MMVYKHLFFIFVFFLFLPLAFAVKPLKLDKNLLVREDAVYFYDENVDFSQVWIDKYEIDHNGNRVYHVDSLVTFRSDESVSLEFYYEVQPDYIDHINHDGILVDSYYPGSWKWKPNCTGFGEFQECFGGWLTLEARGILKSTGSSVFPIGVDGPQWNDAGEYTNLTNGTDYILYDEFGIFSLVNSNYDYQLIYFTYDITEPFPVDISQFEISLDNNIVTALILFVLFAISGIFFLMRLHVFSGGLLALLGFVLLFSGFNSILSFIVVVIGLIVGIGAGKLK